MTVHLSKLCNGENNTNIKKFLLGTLKCRFIIFYCQYHYKYSGKQIHQYQLVYVITYLRVAT